MDCESGSFEQYDLFIDGRHVMLSNRCLFDRHSIRPPNNPSPKLRKGAEAEVEKAVKAARAALKVWGGMRAAERGRILQRAALLLEQHIRTS